MTIDCDNLNQLPEVASKIIEFAGDSKIWLFQGDLGAGKTTLIKAIGDQFDVVDQISSPTFSLINEYLTEDDRQIFHFDFYRIESEKEAHNLGLEEYFDSGELCLIEWPERIPDLIPENYLKISIKFKSDKRIIYLTNHESENQRR